MLVRSIALAVPLALGTAACTTDRSTTPTSSTTSPGGQASAPGARDPMAVPGPSIKGHAEDQVVSGTISEVSPQSVAIRSSMGETKRLDIAPETTVKVDGSDASHADLREGQPVRASYSEVEGRAIAVEIRAGDPSAYDAPAAGVPGSSTPAYPPSPSPGGRASAPGAAGGDPMAIPGPSIKGHAEDQVVSGTISEVSPGSVAIQSTMGETKRLDIEPETTVKVDGSDASHADLREGQPVRASFSEVEGREIAVEIRAGDQSAYDAPAAGVPGWSTPAYPPSPSTGTGTSSDVQPGGPGSNVPRQPESAPAYPPTR